MSDTKMDHFVLDVYRTSSNIDRFLHHNVSYVGQLDSTQAHSRDGTPMPAPAFEVNYVIPNHSFSGLKVDQLKVLGDVMYKPFKGVRMAAKAGKMEVRW